MSVQDSRRSHTHIYFHVQLKREKHQCIHISIHEIGRIRVTGGGICHTSNSTIVASSTRWRYCALVYLR